MSSLPSLSRRHCRIWREPGGPWQIQDLGSRLGTLQRGQPIDGPRPLEPGIPFHIGETSLQLDPAQRPPEARHVELRAALALEVRGHREDRAHRHHAGAADAGEQYVPGPLELGQRGKRQRVELRVVGARANLHAKVLYGRSSHHHIEAVFKAFARALRVACARDARLAKMLPSTKGLL